MVIHIRVELHFACCNDLFAIVRDMIADRHVVVAHTETAKPYIHRCTPNERVLGLCTMVSASLTPVSHVIMSMNSLSTGPVTLLRESATLSMHVCLSFELYLACFSSPTALDVYFACCSNPT